MDTTGFQPRPHRCHGSCGQGRGALFSALATAANIRTGSQGHAFAAQAGNLAHTYTGLDGEGEQCMVAATDPGAAVGDGEDRLNLLFGEEFYDSPLEPFLWDRQDPGNQIGVFGVLESGEPEERMDRGQTGISASDAVPPLCFQIGEERSDRRGIQVAKVEVRRGDPLCLKDECQQQPERVTVGSDCGGADLSLGDEAVGEKLLQGWGEGTHGSSPRNSSRCCPTMANSSGEACRYQ